jgi:hypothetical protein
MHGTSKAFELSRRDALRLVSSAALGVSLRVARTALTIILAAAGVR